jgi:hypothetical protein
MMNSLVVFFEGKLQHESGEMRLAKHMENAKNLTDSFRAIQTEANQRGTTQLNRRQTIGGTSSLPKRSSRIVLGEERVGGTSIDEHGISVNMDDVNVRVGAKIVDILKERGEDRETVADYIRATPTFSNSGNATSISRSKFPSSRIPSLLHDVSARTATLRDVSAPVERSQFPR